MQMSTTNGICITVETMYQPQYSKPLESEYVHAYRIIIENLRDYPVQLLSRHWHIWDATGIWREVEGEGVVGVQPVIPPDADYQYVSGCHLRAEFGHMHGSFEMLCLETDTTFTVEIPYFDLIAPFKYN